MSNPLSLAAVVLVCLTTLAVGGLGLRLSRRTSDFYVAGRTVSPRLNASAIGGEYLSAASFLGVAGLIYDQGVDMVWLPVGYTLGYLVLLVIVAAPMRRSGAYTLPDFAEARLGSRAIRLVSSALVIGIGCLYLIPQFQGASLTLTLVTGAPAWAGGFVVMVVIALAVGAGGMRSITLVQAMQYWIKLTALAVPAFVLLALWFRSGAPSPQVDPSWHVPLSPTSPDDHPTYRTVSIVLALCLGTMGLPHVLVRYYTNPDGVGARRTTVTVIALLGTFYLLPPIYAALGRVAYPTLPAGVGSDTIVLRLPETFVDGLTGQLLRPCWPAGRSPHSSPRHPVWRCRSPASSTRSCCARDSPASPAVTCPASGASGSRRCWRSSCRTCSAAWPSRSGWRRRWVSRSPWRQRRSRPSSCWASGGAASRRGGRWPAARRGHGGARLDRDDDGRRRPRRVGGGHPRQPGDVGDAARPRDRCDRLAGDAGRIPAGTTRTMVRLHTPERVALARSRLPE